MYGITDHYLQTLHDFNTFGGKELGAFLPEQALRAEFWDLMSTSWELSNGRREGLDLPRYRGGQSLKALFILLLPHHDGLCWLTARLSP